MHENVETRKSESSFSGVRRRCRGMVAATQLVLFLALGVTVLVALFYDSRLYYGIDVDGRPIYRESRRAQPKVFDVRPVSADSRDTAEAHG